MKCVRFPLTPVPKPRQAPSDRWRPAPRVARYRAFADRLRMMAALRRFDFPEAGARLLFVLPMPASWSRAKRATMDGQPHQQKPDWDNLAKAVCDALMPEDCRVWNVGPVEKRWGAEGSITIEVDG